MRRYGQSGSKSVRVSGANHEILTKMTSPTKAAPKKGEGGYLWIGIKTTGDPGRNQYIYRNVDAHLFAPVSDATVTRINHRDEDPNNHYLRTPRYNESSTYMDGWGGNYAMASPLSSHPTLSYEDIGGLGGPGAYERATGMSLTGDGISFSALHAVGKRYGYGMASLVSPDPSWQKCFIVDEEGDSHPLNKLPRESVTYTSGGTEITKKLIKTGSVNYRSQTYRLKTQDGLPSYVDDQSGIRDYWGKAHSLRSGAYLVKVHAHMAMDPHTYTSSLQKSLWTRHAGPAMGVTIGVQTRRKGPIREFNIALPQHMWSPFKRDAFLFGETPEGDTRPGDGYAPAGPWYEHGPNTMSEAAGWFKGGVYVDPRRHRVWMPTEHNVESGQDEPSLIIPPFGFDRTSLDTVSRKPLAARRFYWGPMAVGSQPISMAVEAQPPDPARPQRVRGLGWFDLRDAPPIGQTAYSYPWSQFRPNGSLWESEHEDSFTVTQGAPLINTALGNPEWSVSLRTHFAAGYSWEGTGLDRVLYNTDTTPVVSDWSSYYSTGDIYTQGFQELGIMAGDGSTTVSHFVATQYPYEDAGGYYPTSNHKIRQIYADGDSPPDPFAGTTVDHPVLNPDFGDYYAGYSNEYPVSDFEDSKPFAVLTSPMYDNEPIHSTVAQIHDDYYELDGNLDKFQMPEDA